MNITTNIKLYSLVLISFLFTGCENKIEETETIEEISIQGNNDTKEYFNNTTEEDVAEVNSKEEIEDLIDINNENKVEVYDENTSQSTNENHNDSLSNSSTSPNISLPNTENIENDIALEANPVFTKSEIPEHIKQKMIGNSMTKDATVSFDELSYLRISHINYNGETQVGEMIVSNKLADEVLDIFRDIYNAKFPIEKIKLIDEYGASDHKSMVDNNSSAFCYRTIDGTSKVSNHGLGVAIDINPFYNPHVLKSKGKVNPSEASKYSDRSLNDKGMIKKNDAVYKAFTSRGWKWGGHWSNPDYQHFEKKI